MRLLGNRLYIGADMEGYPLIGNLPLTVNKIASCFGRSFNSEGETKSLNRFFIVYNAGIIGGSRHIMLRFLRLLTAMLSNVAGDKNCNTAAVNLIAHKYFDNVTFSGFPMTSQYKTVRGRSIGRLLGSQIARSLLLPFYHSTLCTNGEVHLCKLWLPEYHGLMIYYSTSQPQILFVVDNSCT